MYAQLVTEVDQAVEAFISNAIKEKYPSHKLSVRHTLSLICFEVYSRFVVTVSERKLMPRPTKWS